MRETEQQLLLVSRENQLLRIKVCAGGFPRFHLCLVARGTTVFGGKRQSCLTSLAGVSCSVLADDEIHIKPAFLTRENSEN